MIWRRTIVVIALVATRAFADDGETAFRAAAARAAAGDPDAIEAFEQLGAARPITRWTDNAWDEAARLAERAGDFDRERRDLEQVIATSSDEQLVRRTRGSLDRLAGVVGAAGQWTAVAAAHERLADAIYGRGDPKPALRELEKLVHANRGYPRAAAAMLVIARGWERDGDSATALHWLREAVAAARDADRSTTRIALIRALIRHHDLTAATHAIDQLDTDQAVIAELRDELATAQRHRRLRALAWALLGLLGAAAAISLRRTAGSWRAAARQLARPPIEALYSAPIAAVFIVVAQTGNPLVARAVSAIAVAGAVIAWVSGTSLDAIRRRGDNVGTARVIAHAVLAAAAVVAVAYLAISWDQLIDLVAETWREGPITR